MIDELNKFIIKERKASFSQGYLTGCLVTAALFLALIVFL